MVHGVVETPRTNMGDATYLNAQDFDMTQEASFQSPSKDTINILQMRRQQGAGAGGLSLKTPRSRMPFGNRPNAAQGYGGAEFTPLLKSATRNAAMYRGSNLAGKENRGVPETPAFLKGRGLDNILEGDLTPAPNMDGTMYEEDENGNSYVNGTPIPRIDSSSIADSPMDPVRRRNGGPDSLSDGNQLSLKEQENVIDKIEKENFGLKLKIHFLEEALRKAGPGFSEAALKENTELKVDKVTMQKELHRYRKSATAAEREIETYKQQISDLQDRVRNQRHDEGAQDELHDLRRALDDKEAEIKDLYAKLDEGDRQNVEIDKLRDAVTDLEHDVREKDRVLGDHEDQIELLKQQANERDDEILELEEEVKKSKQEKAALNQDQWQMEIDDAKATIEELQEDIKSLRQELNDAKEDAEQAVFAKTRAEQDLEELQDELANKSIAPKGLNRQIEEKAARLQQELEEQKKKFEELKKEKDEIEGTAIQLQDDLEDMRQEYFRMEADQEGKMNAIERLQQRITDLDQSGGKRVNQLKNDLDEAVRERENLELQVQQLNDQLDATERELRNKNEEKQLLQIRHDALTNESQSLQSELSRTKEEFLDIKHQLDQEKNHALQVEHEIRQEYKSEIDRLVEELEDLRADIREKERIYDDDSSKWEAEKRALQSQLRSTEDASASLKRTIEKLQAVEGSLSGNERKLQEAIKIEKERNSKSESLLNTQISELKSNLETKQRQLEQLQNELSQVREDLRLEQREHKNLQEQLSAVEDEIDVLQSTADEEQERLQADIADSAARLRSLEGELNLYKEELERANDKPNHSILDRQSSNLREVENQLQKVTESERKLQAQLNALSSEMRQLKNRTADIEAERDIARSQLNQLQSRSPARSPAKSLFGSPSKSRMGLGDSMFGSDHEKIELRTSLARLNIELERLRDESKLLAEEKACLEAELLAERENAKDDRLLLKERDLDLLKCDAAAKETIRDLKRQIGELERQAHHLEISLLQNSSPHSSMSGSARKNELVEVRNQLASAHTNIKELRARIKEVEKESAKKVQAKEHEMQRLTDSFETERFELERELQNACDEREILESKNSAAESNIARLKAQIKQLEGELREQRRKAGSVEDQTIAAERMDLHEMLREARVEAERLELDIENRDAALKRAQENEKELREQLKRVRDERAAQRQQTSNAQKELERLERAFSAEQRRWEEERNSLTRSVRFPNMSLSEVREDERETHKRELEEKEKRHGKELRGLAMQIEWLKAKVRREESLRADAAYAKRFVLLQVELYGSCNQADLQLLHQMGIHPSPDTYRTPITPISLKRIGLLVLATIRMKRGAEAWAKNRKVHERIVGKFGEMRRQGLVNVGSTPRKAIQAAPTNSILRSGGGGKKTLNEALMSVAGPSRRVEQLRDGRYR